MKKYIIFILLLFGLISCGKVDTINNNTKNETIEKNQKDIFSEIKQEKEGDKIILSGKIGGEVEEIEILWENGNQSDSYFLKKFKKGDKEWITNLKIDYGNLLDGDNKYTVILYKDNKIYKKIVKIIKYDFGCSIVIDDEIRGKRYNIKLKNTYNCKKYKNNTYFDFVGLKSFGGNIRAKLIEEEKKIYIEDSTKEKQLANTKNDIRNGAFNSHAIFRYIKSLDNKYCINKKYCYFTRGLSGFGTRIWIEISINDLIIEFQKENLSKNFEKFNENEKNFSLLKESFEKMEVEEIAKINFKNISIENIEASVFEHKGSEKYFLVKDSKNGVGKRIYYNLSSCIEEYGDNYSQAEKGNFGYCSIDSFKDGKIYWSTEFLSHGTSIKKYYSTDLKGNTKLEK